MFSYIYNVYHVPGLGVRFCCRWRSSSVSGFCSQVALSLELICEKSLKCLRSFPGIFFFLTSHKSLRVFITWIINTLKANFYKLCNIFVNSQAAELYFHTCTGAVLWQKTFSDDVHIWKPHFWQQVINKNLVQICLFSFQKCSPVEGWIGCVWNGEMKIIYMA